MTDAISVLEQANKKLAAKVEKLRSQLTAAETELAEGETAVRVLKKLGLSPMVDGMQDDGKQSSQEQVRKVLPTSELAALTPREVHQAVDGTITADNVRTILKRLKDAKGTDVRVTDDGRYWREVEEEDVDVFGEAPEPLRPAYETDLDSDIPF